MCSQVTCFPILGCHCTWDTDAVSFSRISSICRVSCAFVSSSAATLWPSSSLSASVLFSAESLFSLSLLTSTSSACLSVVRASFSESRDLFRSSSFVSASWRTCLSFSRSLISAWVREEKEKVSLECQRSNQQYSYNAQKDDVSFICSSYK